MPITILHRLLPQGRYYTGVPGRRGFSDRGISRSPELRNVVHVVVLSFLFAIGFGFMDTSRIGRVTPAYKNVLHP